MSSNEEIPSCSKRKRLVSPKVSPPKISKQLHARCFGKDPVKASNVEEELQMAIETLAFQYVVDDDQRARVEPDVCKRMQMKERPDPVFPVQPFVVPETKKQLKARAERRSKMERDRNFCKWDDSRVPKPYAAETIGTVLRNPSPEISKTRLRTVPREPSISVTFGIPDAPIPAELLVRKPKSGIYINITGDDVCDARDSFDLVFAGKPRPIRAEAEEPEPSENKLESINEYTERESSMKENVCNVSVASMKVPEKLKSDKVETPETRSYCSCPTSLNSRDLEALPERKEVEETENDDCCLDNIVQKFRRDAEAERYKSPTRKIIRGTLESHSFTKMHQPTLKDFYYGIVLGTVNQRDSHFANDVRGQQGICIPIAAYCYAMLLHPNKWTELIVDDVLEIGSNLYKDSLEMAHLHEPPPELQYHQLCKYCIIETKKLKFQVHEPEIVGQVRSCDKKMYNITKGLKVFFKRHHAGILKSFGLHVAIWKDKHYYMYDGGGRRKDLHSDRCGQAVLIYVYDIPELTTILLKYTNLDNRPFTISKISISKIVGKCEPEEEIICDVSSERSFFNIIDEDKAVVLASYDLSDLCFDFTRNKQAIAMATVCLVYSRITPPSSWHRRTLDKIMLIGNQLYLELVESEGLVEMSMENIPAIFTIGPYEVELLIYLNIYCNNMFKKGCPMLQKALEKFFATNNMAIVCIEKATLAIWFQRNMYYCFDPYTRNNEGIKCRRGNACVSMNSSIESVVNTVSVNFCNPDDIFYLHALKVVKIHRDPSLCFPKHTAMEDIAPECFKTCRVRKSKRKAVEKKVTGNFCKSAVKDLQPWDYLDASIIDIGSTVGSLQPEELPDMRYKFPLKVLPPVCRKTIDLDSPSLSDTQIDHVRPEPKLDGADSWELTLDELELEEEFVACECENEEEEEEEEKEDDYEKIGEDEDEDECEKILRTSKRSEEMLESIPSRVSAEVNTNITIGCFPIPRDILKPTNISWKLKILKAKELERKRQCVFKECRDIEPEVTQSMEWEKETNFINLPDCSQILLGTCNISAMGDDIEYMAPFVCMMASAVAQKYNLNSWSKEIVDYTLRSGFKLYSLSKVRYDQVPILDVPRVTLGCNRYSILTEYLHDAVLKLCVLEETLMKVLFKRYDCGLVATPSYACAVFFYRHLFYLFDCFGCNEVGLGEGPTNTGVACIIRYRNIRDMVKRIIHNKTKRDMAEEYEFTHFVVSGCTSKPLALQYSPFKCPDESCSDTDSSETDIRKFRENRVGYQLHDGMLTLQGTKALEDRETINYDELKKDHFVCICACLLLVNYPILRWDTKRVDYVIDQGCHIYDHAENLEISEKRIIRNVLMYKNFFDIIITSVRIPLIIDSGNFSRCLEWITKKRDYVLVQFPNCCYVIYKHNTYFHVFDPYPCLPNGIASINKKGLAGWTIFNNLEQAKTRIRYQVIKNGEHFLFYSFEITSISKAPKSLIVGQRMLQYEMNYEEKPEKITSPFHERESWLIKTPIPWSRIKSYTEKEVPRVSSEKWNRWDIEYPNDLFSLMGTIHQKDERFDLSTRGKQTLANIVVAIGMTEIYPLAEWSACVVDSILTNGDNYFKKCICNVTKSDYEFTTDDLLPVCSIYPYEFKIALLPVIDGTMFLMRSFLYPWNMSEDNENVERMDIDNSKGEKMFTLKKWNAVAMWSWDVECDTCAICRVQVMDACLRCQAESKRDSYGKQDCVVVWGECNHSFHYCCMSLWVKQNNRCPLCQQEWSIQRMGK
ncbi:hypothetical protein FQA39_LY17711 [Lamprigera yunnana]|nr:hypothetical protein FQA39_LY17711 [Lamprigera yunnana]